MKFWYVEKLETILNRWVSYIERATLTSVLQMIQNCYIQVFNEQGEFEWREGWDQTTVTHLFEEIANNQGNERKLIGSILTNTDPEGDFDSVLGFCLGFVVEGVKNILLQDMPFHVPEAIREEALRRLRTLLSAEEKLIFLRELGIVKEKRGGLLQIMRLLSVALKFTGGNVNKVIFWTSEKTYLYYLVLGTGARIIHQCNDPKRHIFFEYNLQNFEEILKLSDKQLQGIIASTLANLKLAAQQPR